MNEHILITGSTGTIGTQLVNLLQSKNIPVRAAVTSMEKAHSGVNAVVVDYRKPDTLDTALQNISTLFLLIPDTPSMVDWARTAIEAAQRAKVKHIVRSSGIGASVTSPYMIMQVLGEVEQIVASSGIDYTLIRPNSFMQNFATFDSHAIRSGTLYTARSDAHISFVDAHDIAATAAEVLLSPNDHKGETYTLTGPKAYSMQDVVDTIGEVLEQQITHVAISSEVAGQQMRQYGIPGWNVEALLSLYQADRNGETAIVTNCVEAIVGRPPVSLIQFVRDYASAWKEPC